MLQASQLPPEQVRHQSWARHASIQHRSSGNSAPAAPALTLLSATLQWPSSKHGAATKSCCWTSPMLQASQLPPKQVRHYFWAHRASVQSSCVTWRRQLQCPRCFLREQHLPASGPDPAPLRCCLMTHTLQTHCLPPNRMHCNFWRNVRQYNIVHAATQRRQHQHPRDSLRATASCQQLPTIPHRCAMALQLACCKNLDALQFLWANHAPCGIVCAALIQVGSSTCAAC